MTFWATDTGNRVLDKDFHIYGFEWREGYFFWFVDGKKTWRQQAPNKPAPLYIILSTELADKLPGWTGELAKVVDNETLIVDYVKVYTLDER